MKVMISNGSVPALFQARFIVAIGREVAEAAPGPHCRAPFTLHVLLPQPRGGAGEQLDPRFTMLGASLTTSFDHDAPRLGSTKERLMSGGAGRQGNMGTHGGLSLRVVTYAFVGSPIFGDRPDQARSAWPTRPLLATLTAHPLGRLLA